MRYRGRAGTKKALKNIFDKPWHKWFAWHPVDVNGKTKWLTVVFRKGTLEFAEVRDGRDSWEKAIGIHWQYAESIFDILKDGK